MVCFRIALQEETNRMSANALAIVFAPCILRCPDTIDPLQSVQDISKTTAYVRCPQLSSAVRALKQNNCLQQRSFMDQNSFTKVLFLDLVLDLSKLFLILPTLFPISLTLTNVLQHETDNI